MTLEEAIEEIRDHAILIDFRILRGVKALRVIDEALKDYIRLKQKIEANASNEMHLPEPPEEVLE